MSPSTSATSPGMRNPENRREILADDKLEAVFGKKKERCLR
jgi:chromatin remodeling complex protein RSC6